MYNALVTTLKLVPIPKADRLLLGITPNGFEVVVGIETTEDELGIFFPGDGQLSEEFCVANDLIGYTDPDTGERKGGYFPKNRRVREQNFRGQRSEGFWCPLSYLSYLDDDKAISSLKQGDTFTEISGHKVCDKYMTPATLRAMSGQTQQRKANPKFAKHVDTEQLKYVIPHLQPGSIVYITEKLHGTSGRTGYVEALDQRVRLWDRVRNRGLGTKYEALTGTRNTVLRDPNAQGFHGSEGFRHAHARRFQHLLNPGETVYYELVGYANGAPIMSPHDVTKLKDKKLLKEYGPTMTYSYGITDPTSSQLHPPVTNELYVYRITQASGDDFVELSWPQVRRRAKQLGLKTVPDITHFALNEVTTSTLVHVAETCGLGSSLLDTRHIREGVVLRLEQPDGTTRFVKHKSFNFKLLEGIAKESDDVVDMEEAS